MISDKKNNKEAGFSEDDNEKGSTSTHSEMVPGPEVSEEDHTKAAMDAISLAQKEAEVAQREMLYLRAEFENYKKRMLKDQSDAIKLANKGLISEFLGVVDAFDRALQHSGQLKAKGDADVGNFIMGIEMTRSELSQLLVRFGVEFIGAVGEKFDPEKHEAVSQIETSDDKVDSVVEVFQKGCLYQGKLLKPARVVVGKKKA